jgi:hypothetical protein
VLSYEALHYFWAYGAFVGDVGTVWHGAEVPEAVLALSGGFLACDNWGFCLNQFRIDGVFKEQFDF